MKTSEFVRVRVVDNLAEIEELTIMARSLGYLLVCDRCRSDSEPLAAIVSLLADPNKT